MSQSVPEFRSEHEILVLNETKEKRPLVYGSYDWISVCYIDRNYYPAWQASKGKGRVGKGLFPFLYFSPPPLPSPPLPFLRPPYTLKCVFSIAYLSSNDPDSCWCSEHAYNFMLLDNAEKCTGIRSSYWFTLKMDI